MYKIGILTVTLRRLAVQYPRTNTWIKIFPAPKFKPSHRVFATSSYAPPAAAVYPEHLMIYHAGTMRTAFVGFLKINTIFLFAFSCLILAPSFYRSPERPNWAIPAVIIGGAIPMIFVTYTSIPFVTSVRIKLPGFARRSKDQLRQWVQKMPSNTQISLTTMRFTGRPRLSCVLLSDLREIKTKWGIANLARVSNSTASASRPWWMGKDPPMFYVAEKGTKSRRSSSPITEAIALQQFMWQNIMARIQKQ